MQYVMFARNLGGFVDVSRNRVFTKPVSLVESPEFRDFFF